MHPFARSIRDFDQAGTTGPRGTRGTSRLALLPLAIASLGLLMSPVHAAASDVTSPATLTALEPTLTPLIVRSGPGIRVTRSTGQTTISISLGAHAGAATSQAGIVLASRPFVIGGLMLTGASTASVECWAGSDTSGRMGAAAGMYNATVLLDLDTGKVADLGTRVPQYVACGGARAATPPAGIVPVGARLTALVERLRDLGIDAPDEGRRTIDRGYGVRERYCPARGVSSSERAAAEASIVIGHRAVWVTVVMVTAQTMRTGDTVTAQIVAHADR